MHHFTLHKTLYHAVMLWIKIFLDCAKTFLVYHLRGAAFWHHSSPTTLPFVRLRLLSSLIFAGLDQLLCCYVLFLLSALLLDISLADHHALFFVLSSFRAKTLWLTLMLSHTWTPFLWHDGSHSNSDLKEKTKLIHINIHMTLPIDYRID